MFSPVGNQPPSVYWRRRLFVIGAAVLLVLLLVLTVRVVAGGSDGGTPAAGATTSTSGSSTPSPRPTTSAGSQTSSASRSATTKQSSQQATATTPAVVAPVACAARDLAVQAVAGQTAYKIGAEPVVALQVTNTGAKPCTQDLADKQVVLRVYNGESRVWGSHDCEVQPGTTVRTLLTNQPVRVTITWSGRTSQEGCKGTRQRVGAGSYTLYAQLAGKSGKAANFTIG